MKTIIIAEAGVNHNGCITTAIDMIHQAARAGADYVKFQTFKAENLVAAYAPKAEYQKENTGDSDTSQLDMLRALELSYSDFEFLRDECQRCGIGFMSSPFDLESIDFLATLGMDYWKIPSGEITNYPYLASIARHGGRAILSTGMSTMVDVESAIRVLTDNGMSRSDIILLHCTTQYPTPPDAVNLRAMDTLATLGCATVGYSDHTLGITIPIAAVARGAAVIEKHFTLYRTMPGPDHRASLEPDELAEMVSRIREVELALGSPDKAVTAAEAPNVAIARKSIVAARDIAAGEVFTEENLTVKRPGTGLSPMLWPKIIRTPAKREFRKDEQIII